jgi:hypothetical protein
MAQQSSLGTFGFAYVAHPSGRAEWTNQAWIESEYIPSCLELIKTLTGAETALHLFPAGVRRTDYASHPGTMPAAGFAHLDLPRDAYASAATMVANAQVVKLKRGAVYNVWKAITPPPRASRSQCAIGAPYPRPIMYWG